MKIEVLEMAVCIREIHYRQFNCLDRELFVKFNTSNGEFDLPVALPTRFTLRSTALGHDVYKIDSNAHEKSLLTTRAGLELNGVWITKSDGIARGGVRPSIFGIPLSTRAKEALDLLPSSNILSTYHGTGTYESIQEMNRLVSTVGQLGRGVYVGSFWKAVRFATRTQNYELRDTAVVLRILSFCKSVKVYPTFEPCKCKEYCHGRSLEKARCCDHLKDWNLPDTLLTNSRSASEEHYICGSQVEYDAGQLLVGQHSDGTWRTQNEEWVLRPDRVLRLAEAVKIDMSTINKDKYEPQQRNVRIL